MVAGDRARLSGISGRTDPCRPCGGRTRIEDAEDAGPLSAGGGPRGRLVTVDDRRFDPMWETCAALRAAGGAFTSRIRGVLLPIDRFERAVRGAASPPRLVVPRARLSRLQGRCSGARSAVRTAPEDDLGRVSRGAPGRRISRPSLGCSIVSPTCSSDLAARIGELGRQPRASRAFFERYQDRILFGTDAVPNGHETPQQIFGDGCTRSTTGSSRPKTNTSTTRRLRYRRRDGGVSTASVCQTPF